MNPRRNGLVLYVRLLARAIIVLATAPLLAGCGIAAMSLGSTRAATMVRWYFQTAGGVLLKLGQFLATRYDLLPTAFCDELSTLLDSVPPVAVRHVIAELEASVGGSLDSVFASVDQRAIAAASIAQVHRATLLDGSQVIVKVKRPGVDTLFRWDLRLLRLVSRLPVLPGVDLRPIALEVSELTLEELDFRREARNAEAIHHLLLSDPVDHYSPQVYLALCSESVITLEFIEGVSVVDLLSGYRASGGVVPDSAADNSLKRTSRLLLRSVLEQMIHHRFFNADPHPGNLILMPSGTLAWVDFGMTGTLDEKLWRSQFRLRLAIATRDVDEAYEALLESLEPLPDRDLSGFEFRTKRLIDDWVRASEDPNAGLIEKSSGAFLMGVLEAARQWSLQLPSNVVRLYRTMLIADMVMLRLDPAIDWRRVLQSFMEEEVARTSIQSAQRFLSPARLLLALGLWIQTPLVVSRLLALADRKLPEAARVYRREGSRLQRFAVGLLEDLRDLALLTVAFVAVNVLTGGAVAAFLEARLGTVWMRVGGLGLMAALLFARAARRAR